jgi:membrane fusion protein, copper/silver efflux system
MNKSVVIIAVVMLVIGIGLGGWLGDVLENGEYPVEHKNMPSDMTTKSKQPLFYRHPMNPTVISPMPAKDNMGMDYIAVYADDSTEENEPAGMISIDPVTEQNIGVRTAIASRETISRIVRAVGRVAYDEERLVRLHPKTEGWIETLRIDKTGQWVKKNDDLLSIYSPQLVTSQQEYILALRNLKALEASPIADIRHGAEELVKSSRERLKLLDVPEHQMHDLNRTHTVKKSLHIHSPAAGIVMNIGAREGQYVTPATELYMIADLSTVWVYADIYEYELPWVKVGDSVEMRLAGVPGRTFNGQLAYIYPYAEPKTRTIKVRLAFDNTAFLLKPDMFAEVTIHAGKRVKAITIPSESVIRSGSRDQVFVMRAPGKFEPRLVTLGLTSNGKVAVNDGVKEGERIVTSAQFLLDSESKLREVVAKMIDPQNVKKMTSMESMPKVIERDLSNHNHGSHQDD